MSLNKYDKEILKEQETRDKLILAEISIIYNTIKDKAQKLAMDVTNKAGDNTNYFSERAGRNQAFAKKVNKELRPDYLKRDNFSKNVYAEEYRTSYFTAKYAVENQGIADGYKFKLPRYQKKQFTKALNYPLSKLMNDAKMKTGRSVDIEQLYTTIVSGVEQGLSLPNINKNLDVNLGYRDAQTGKWLSNPAFRKGQQYKTRRILRTEIDRIRNQANTDQWINQQDTVQSDLILVETLDDRTRQQSAQMDGQKANKKGKFLFPNGQYSFASQSGVAKWDINDRSTTINQDPEYPPENRIARDPKTGKNSTVPYQNFETWAKSQNPPLNKNRYGEYLFSKPSKPKVKPKPSIIKPAIKTPFREMVKSQPVGRAINKSDVNKIKSKKSEWGLNNSNRIADEFNVSLDRVLQVESDYLKLYPRRKLTIDQMRSLVVKDISSEVELLKKQLRSLK